MGINMQNAPNQRSRKFADLGKSALFLSAGCVIPVLVVAGLMLWLMVTACGSRVLQTMYSPSAQYLVEVEESDCGAFNGLESYVMLRRMPYWASSLHLNTASEVFILKDSSSLVRVHWESETQLEIECPNCKGKEYILQTNWRGISIHYVIS